jgi:hypothetical protein
MDAAVVVGSAVLLLLFLLTSRDRSPTAPEGRGDAPAAEPAPPTAGPVTAGAPSVLASGVVAIEPRELHVTQETSTGVGFDLTWDDTGGWTGSSANSHVAASKGLEFERPDTVVLWAGAGPRTHWTRVRLPADGSTSRPFAVACEPPMGCVALTAATTGPDVDVDGYAPLLGRRPLARPRAHPRDGIAGGRARRLRGFVSEVEAQAARHVSEEVATVLLDDGEYVLGSGLLAG